MKKDTRQLVIRRIVLVIVSLAIGLGIYSWNAESLTGNKMPMPLGFGIGMVLTGSMEPEICPNDLIFVVASDEYREGDNVVFQDGYMLVVHRIRSIDGDTVVTYGIANNGDDPPMDISNIKGKVAFSIPRVGTVVTLLKSPLATAVIIALAALLLIRSYRKDEEENLDALDEIKKQIEQLKTEYEEEAKTEDVPTEEREQPEE